MLPVISVDPQQEPIVPVVIDSTVHPFMIDTGATYSCIGNKGSKLPLSSSSVKTVGFSGKTQVIPLTEPIPMQIHGKTVISPLLYSVDSPVNLLGRDLLCSLEAQIMCTPDGVYLDIPQTRCEQMMALLKEKDEQLTQAAVYWLELLPESSMLMHQWRKWKIWIKSQLGKSKEPELIPHCTLMYDLDQQKVDYELCWKEQINGKEFPLIAEDIYVSRQGAAAAVKLPSELEGWHEVADAVPHVTLAISEGYESQALGPMVKAALQIQEWIPTANPCIHMSKDKEMMRISNKTVDTVMARRILVESSPIKQMFVTNQRLLQEVPETLWSKDKMDVGLVKSARPTRITIRSGTQLPKQRQYPLTVEAIEGIKPTIEGLEKAGVLVKTRSSCNTPIYPIRKPNSDNYRLVHDLRAINAIVDADIPTVPDPHTMLSNIPPDTEWYTVIDLCSAFFSVPLHEDSQYLFAFTYQGQQYTYTRMPQGFCESPTVFNRVLQQDLQHVNIESTLIQYFDDILICSTTKEQCENDSITVLKALADGGHKVSLDKLHFCKQEVEYLGRRLRSGKRYIAQSQIEAVTNAPKPTTVGQMLTFLGLTGFNRQWICDYALKTAPLRTLIKTAGQGKNANQLQWTDEAVDAFTALKLDLQTAPALGSPDYSKPFHLYVAEKQGYATAVLTQDTPTGKQPLAYYSTKLDAIESGMPPCYQGLAAAAFAYQKASVLTMGHKVKLYTSHQLHALLTSPKFVMTQARKTGYEVILAAPELHIQRCTTVNPALKVPVPADGEPHDCVQCTDEFLKIRSDMCNAPISASMTLFVDGSCYRDDSGMHAGYAVIQLQLNQNQPEKAEFHVLQAQSLPQPCSAQLAEIKALTAACMLATGQTVNIYTDSAYAYGVCHIYGGIWKQRGFMRADNTPISHKEAICDLLQAIQLPKAIAIIKCPAHQKTDTWVTKGNNKADEVARTVASPRGQGVLMVNDGNLPTTDLRSLAQAQEHASVYEKSLWLRRGANQQQTHDAHGTLITSAPGLWRGPQGHLVAPLSVLYTLIHDAHGLDHCARGEVIKKIKQVWWSPYLAAMVDKELENCVTCATYNNRKSFSAPIGHIPAPDGPFRHLVIDHVDMLERVQGKRYMLVVVDRFTRWVEAVPVAGPDAASTVKFLYREVFPRFGIPDSLSSDNGPAFVHKMVDIITKQLRIKQRLGCVYHPQSQGIVERANGTLKAKIAKICADRKINWVDALPLALMSMRMNTNRVTHLTPHEMLTGRPMPVSYLRGPYKGPPLEQLESEMVNYVRHLTAIHRSIFQQVKGATEERQGDIPLEKQSIEPGDWVYIKRFKRKWNEPKRTGPFRVILVTPTALKVEGKTVWFHLNHCSKASEPQRACKDIQVHLKAIKDDSGSKMGSESTQRMDADAGDLGNPGVSSPVSS